MGHNRRFFKVISIVQVVMSAIFLVLGMVDRYEVRFVYTSYVFAPCWIAALINAVSSVSMTSVIVSGITAYQYIWTVNRVLAVNLLSTRNSGSFPFVKKDAALKLTDQKNTAVAISSLVAIFCITEVAIAVCAAWISDSLFQTPQENQVSQARNVNNQFEYGQIPTYTAGQPMIGIPSPSYNALQ
ncbi:uncharacterized protein [Montipora foliosa]|uniref:uncharacterized protein isoform X2 n=1 Tax=Montipora foliosa TaxID=591990 RepID=UPI0035F1E39E